MATIPARPVSVRHFAVAHPTPLPSLTTMICSPSSPRLEEVGSPISVPVTALQDPMTGRATLHGHHSLLQLSAAAEFFVINPIAQHDVEFNPEFARRCDLRFAQPRDHQYTTRRRTDKMPCSWWHSRSKPAWRRWSRSANASSRVSFSYGNKAGDASLEDQLVGVCRPRLRRKRKRRGSEVMVQSKKHSRKARRWTHVCPGRCCE